MLITLSIDLNFLSVPTLAYETLGFNIFEPIQFHFYMNDTKMINYPPEEILHRSLTELIGLGLVIFEAN